MGVTEMCVHEYMHMCFSPFPGNSGETSEKCSVPFAYLHSTTRAHRAGGETGESVNTRLISDELDVKSCLSARSSICLLAARAKDSTVRYHTGSVLLPNNTIIFHFTE